ncbi:DNA polymerase III alpha subunit [Gordonia phage Terapin]|uniref:DnaE-like DNA polymerase III alpha n=5 Tax=Terapinvirus terapin TaxID=2734283 RepID=A0A345MBA4_9CAUD|nr:DNA polymerase III alpha subunit [Gordonia phage Terapin]AVP43341.1 DNA polymerase III alpha [Gordonia phage Djokovic]AXH67775.1 DnaE-like DNA polymerase III alpha [Gordonia phage Beyoncage]QOC56209.1 DnaE-like DNA polymerase III [Gordonia phage Sienna]QOC56634.1 DnaE-like DNA polymerase III [Gordonia phage BiteSize]AOE44877.1 DNA polymerase III alpha subunit [Gordonia phage Terapin]
MRYVSLHTHTTFSYGDGYGPVADHVERAVELGMSALSATEHGNTSSHAQLEKECKKHGIKPIFGCELYIAPTDRHSPYGAPIKTRKKYHQTVLAADEQGYQNLNRIVTASYRDHFFQWPTATARLLSEYCDGLVVLSGCSDSLLSCTLLGGKEQGDKRTEFTEKHFENARRVIEYYQGLFGERYFLECQRFPRLERTCTLNAAFAELSKTTGARLVASSDVHYPRIEHRQMQKILHSAHRGGTIEDAESGDWDYEAADLTYPTSDKEIFHDLVATGLTKSEAKDAITATRDIARSCNVELPKNEPIKYPISDDDWKPW